VAQKPPLLLMRSKNKATTNLHGLPLKFLTLVPCTMIPVMRILVMRAWCWMTLMALTATMMILQNHWSLTETLHPNKQKVVQKRMASYKSHREFTFTHWQLKGQIM